MRNLAIELYECRCNATNQVLHAADVKVSREEYWWGLIKLAAEVLIPIALTIAATWWVLRS
jgi:hypothetical protein